MNKLNNTKKIDHFFCYSKKVSDYLKSNGVDYVTVAIDPKTQRMYSLYVVTEQLNKLLNTYKNN